MSNKKYHYSSKEITETSLPQVWGKNPIFAATKQIKPRSVILAEGITWTMGVDPPFGDVLSKYQRGFDIRHAEVIFRLLSFYRENDIDFDHRVDLSFYRLLEIVGWPRSAKSLNLLKEILADLSNVWTEINTSQEKSFLFRVLSASVDRNKKIKNSNQLRYITFDPSFLEFLNNVEEFFSIRLDVFEGIKGKIAKAAYLYLPSRALRNTYQNPFRIKLTLFLEQVGIIPPKYKSQRLQKINRYCNLQEELNNKLINFTQKLCVKLEETKDKKDYILCVWTASLSDNDINFDRENSLKTWFLNGKNGSLSEFESKIKKFENLSSYELSVLELATIDIEKSRHFLLLSKSLLGSFCFAELCAQVKNATLEGKVKAPMAYFITLVKSELLGELPLF